MHSERGPTLQRTVAALCWLLLSCGALAMFLQSVLSSAAASTSWMSRRLWKDLSEWLSGDAGASVSGTVDVPFLPLFVVAAGFVFGFWLIGTTLAALRSRQGWRNVATSVAMRGGCVWMLVGVLEFARLLAPEAAGAWIVATTHLWFSLAVAVFAVIPAWLSVGAEEPVVPKGSRLAWTVVGAGVAAFVLVFTWMNWRLYANLLIPHGDSAMYEEHIWNLTHGKGFRSYLDDGRLFLGEHIQVVHLALTPLHLLWPSHLLLELCESVALASAAIPIYLIARRHCGRPLASAGLAIAWLLYFPMHYLDVAIDFKTFRPICFGIPAMLFCIDQWERGRLKTAAVLLVVTLSAKEDFALVLAPLALYFGLTATDKRERWFGLGGCVGVALYLAVIVLVVIPAFRSGAEVHYSRYFGELGSSPAEIVKTGIRDPMLVLSRLFSPRSFLYTALLLLPCGFLPMLSVRRVMVAVPAFGMLCLLELAPGDVVGEAPQQQMLVPFHHFHATVLPVLWWAAGAGLSRFRIGAGGSRSITAGITMACAGAISTCVFYSMSPLGVSFHDPGSRQYWQTLYEKSERAEHVERVLAAIPDDARVASTDFVHTRLTHRERSYDYSGYRRTVPPDADYIVIDARHPWPGYSMASRVEDVREWKDDADAWEVMDLETDGYFIVLKRRR